MIKTVIKKYFFKKTGIVLNSVGLVFQLTGFLIITFGYKNSLSLKGMWQNVGLKEDISTSTIMGTLKLHFLVAPLAFINKFLFYGAISVIFGLLLSLLNEYIKKKRINKLVLWIFIVLFCILIFQTVKYTLVYFWFKNHAVL